MKKKIFIGGIMGIFLLIMFMGCASQPAIPERFYVEPNSNNPQQGNYFWFTNNRINERAFLTVDGNTLICYSFQNFMYTETSRYLLGSSTTEWKFSDDFQFVYRMDGSRLIDTYIRHDVKYGGK